MTTQEKLEEILDRLAVRMYDEGQLDKPSLMGRQVAIANINETKAQIQVLINSAKREGRLEAANYFKKYMISTSPFIDQILDPYIEENTRLAQLEQSKEEL